MPTKPPPHRKVWPNCRNSIHFLVFFFFALGLKHFSPRCSLEARQNQIQRLKVNRRNMRVFSFFLCTCIWIWVSLPVWATDGETMLTTLDRVIEREWCGSKVEFLQVELLASSYGGKVHDWQCCRMREAYLVVFFKLCVVFFLFFNLNLYNFPKSTNCIKACIPFLKCFFFIFQNS